VKTPYGMRVDERSEIYDNGHALSQVRSGGVAWTPRNTTPEIVGVAVSSGETPRSTTDTGAGCRARSPAAIYNMA